MLALRALPLVALICFVLFGASSAFSQEASAHNCTLYISFNNNSTQNLVFKVRLALAPFYFPSLHRLLIT